MVTTSTDRSVDIAVIGAGPGGLACAAAVKVALGAGVTIKVYESLSEYRPQGSGVVLQPNAQYALQAIDEALLQRFKQNALAPGPNSGTHYDLKGNAICTLDPGLVDMEGMEKKYGLRPLIIGWHIARQYLYDWLPEDTVVFGRKVTHYDEAEDGVLLHFRDGQPAVHAKVVIGADGFFSKIRKQCLDDGPPDFTGKILWRACVNGAVAAPDGPDSLAWSRWRERDEVYDPDKDPAAVLFPMGTKADKVWAWTLAASLEDARKAGVEFDPNERSLESVQGEVANGDALTNVLKVFSFMPDDLMDIVRRTDPSAVTQHGLYVRNIPEDSTQTWGRGRVTLIGDAAHAFLPNGQGLCLALEDAVVLAWHLKQQGLMEEALRRYEDERLPRVKAVYKYGIDSADPAGKEAILYKPTFKHLNGSSTQAVTDKIATCINDFP